MPEARTKSLVLGAQRGDPEAFDALVRAYLRAAYAVALGIVRRPADAEDVAQDAMLLAFERIASCREPERFGGWLLAIVRNQAKNWLERRKLRDVSARDDEREGASDATPPDTAAEREPLLRALERLGAAEREVVLLHDLEGWTHAEIGSALEISEVMSRQHLFLARKKLRSELDAPAIVRGGT